MSKEIFNVLIAMFAWPPVVELILTDELTASLRTTLGPHLGRAPSSSTTRIPHGVQERVEKLGRDPSSRVSMH